MAKMQLREQIAAKAEIRTDAPQLTRPSLPDRSFELPTALYACTFGLFVGFMAIMVVGFANPGLILPIAIIGVLLVAFFGVPAIWTQLAPATPVGAKSWARFRFEGIQTATGHTSARDATVQVLILPVLIFLWGVCAVVIAALV